MRFRHLLGPALLAAVPAVLAAHDLFLTMAAYFVAPGAGVSIVALNGTFDKSENRVRTETEGTYVAGLATRASELSETADAFNKYLAEEGIGPALAERKRLGELGRPVREQYSKHVKTLFQVGKSRTEGWNTVLGYPVEIVPLRNPYTLTPGDTLRFRILVDGAASPAGQEVLAGGRTSAGRSRTERHLVTDAKGEISVLPGPAGVWYVKFIRMTRTGRPGIDYISQWATLTYAVAPAPGKAP